MAEINAYLTFNGNCEEAFQFYQSVLGGSIPYLGRYKDMPESDRGGCVAEDENKIMHVSLQLDNGSCIMGADSSESFGLGPFVAGNNFSLSVNTASRDEADKVFNGLSQGGKVTMPLQDTFWGAYFGMWVDKFGINWMVNYDDPAKMQH